MPLYRRLPKRGFKNKFQKKIQTINFKTLHSFIAKYNIDSKNIKESELFEKKILNKSKGYQVRHICATDHAKVQKINARLKFSC